MALLQRGPHLDGRQSAVPAVPSTLPPSSPSPAPPPLPSELCSPALQDLARVLPDCPVGCTGPWTALATGPHLQRHLLPGRALPELRRRGPKATCCLRPLHGPGIALPPRRGHLSPPRLGRVGTSRLFLVPVLGGAANHPGSLPPGLGPCPQVSADVSGVRPDTAGAKGNLGLFKIITTFKMVAAAWQVRCPGWAEERPAPPAALRACLDWAGCLCGSP